MHKSISKDNDFSISTWFQKNKKTLILTTTVIGSMMLGHQYFKSSISQKFNEFDFLRKAPINIVNEYREKIRVLHSKGEVGMWEKLTWIDKVIRNRPENITNKNLPLNLPRREHGWYL